MLLAVFELQIWPQVKLQKEKLNCRKEEEFNVLYREIASQCKISKSSIEIFCRQGKECKSPKKGVIDFLDR